MKILVIMNGDAHFRACKISQREEVIELLQDVEDGDYWANEFNEEPADLLKLTEEVWEEWVDGATSSGRAEIVNVQI